MQPACDDICRWSSSRPQKPSKECEPYAMNENKPIAPCGAIANSMFNGEPLSSPVDLTQMLFKSLLLSAIFPFFLADTFELFYNDPNGTKVQIPLSNTGIAWWTDKHVKFRNPGLNNPNLTAAFQGTSRSSFFVYLPLGSLTLQPNMEAKEFHRSSMVMK